MKIAILSSRFPFPLEKGDKLRLFHQIRCLSKDHEVCLYALTDIDISTEDYNQVKQYCHRIFVYKLSFFSRIWNSLLCFIRKWPIQVGYFYNSSIYKKMVYEIENEKPDYLYCQLIRMAEYAKAMDIPKCLDYMDAFSHSMRLRYHSAPWWQKPFFKRESFFLKKYETKIAPQFDQLTIISEQDKSRMGLALDQIVSVIPNGVDFNYFNNKNKIPKVYDMVFVGNMGYYPNVMAAKFIIEKIVPNLIKVKPEVKILIAGARPSAVITKFAHPQVTVSGWIEDIREAYLGSKIFIAPIYHGAGLQNKIIEAMALGIPCICTPQVNNAIGARENEILICSHPQDWVKLICKLLDDTDRQSKMAQAASIFVTENFSWEHSTHQLEELFYLS